MSKFVHALLSRTLDLTTTEIEAWLKLASFAGGPNSMTGIPWEILCLSDLTPDHIHPVVVYGKNGATAAYRSQLSFVDGYGIAIVVLTTGLIQAEPLLVDVMLSTFVSVVDKVSRYQAKNYERDFTTHEKTDAPIKSTLSQDGDSLVLSSLHRNGTDLFSGLTDLWRTIMGDFIPEILFPIRIFPTGLFTKRKLNGKPIVCEVWHLRPDLMSSFNTNLPGRGL